MLTFSLCRRAHDSRGATSCIPHACETRTFDSRRAQDVTLDDFAPLPKYYTVGTEANGNSSHIDSKVPITGDGHFRSVTDALTNAEMSWRPPPSFTRSIGYGNAGIMLINVPWMRRTYDEFVAWTFSGVNIARGLHFGPFGPGDQGAYNQFYTGKFNVHRWPLFNWKPYWGYNPRAKLVHFHGPKARGKAFSPVLSGGCV